MAENEPWSYHPGTRSVCAAPIPFFRIAGLGMLLAERQVTHAVLVPTVLQSYGLTESTGGFTLLGPADHVPAAGSSCPAPGS